MSTNNVMNFLKQLSIDRFHVTSHKFRSPYWWSTFPAEILKIAGDTQENEVKSSENISEKASIPLSDYANKLEPKVKKRYLEKISAIGIDPVLIEGKNFQPDCLPPLESTDLLFYLVLETSYYTKQQFKAFRSLQAYNQMVYGFISSVQGHIVKDTFVVLAKVKHSQRMNDSLIPVWIITEKQGTIIAHCCGCKAGRRHGQK